MSELIWGAGRISNGLCQGFEARVLTFSFLFSCCWITCRRRDRAYSMLLEGHCHLCPQHHQWSISILFLLRSVSRGCEIMPAFKKTLILADTLVALRSWGFAGVSGCKVLFSHASLWLFLPLSSAGRVSHGKVRQRGSVFALWHGNTATAFGNVCGPWESFLSRWPGLGFAAVFTLSCHFAVVSCA